MIYSNTQNYIPSFGGNVFVTLAAGSAIGLAAVDGVGGFLRTFPNAGLGVSSDVVLFVSNEK